MGEGDAGERAGAAVFDARVGGAGGGQGATLVDGDEGVDLPVAGLDAGEAVGGQFDGGDGFARRAAAMSLRLESIMGVGDDECGTGRGPEPAPGFGAADYSMTLGTR